MIFKPVTFADPAPAKAPGQATSRYDYPAMVREASLANQATQGIMPAVMEDIRKGWRQLPNAGPERSAKSWFNDPMTLQYSMGYKDRRYSLTYDMLRQMASKLAVVNAIVNTRAAQISSFAQPFTRSNGLGFKVKHKDSDHATTNAELEHIKDLEKFIMQCGRSEPNPYTIARRDDFDDFLRKVVRDSLIFDQFCAEIVPDKLGIPYEFMAVDAATIRIACHVAGTEIELSNGAVRVIEDIVLGDTVRTHTGATKEVMSIIDNGLYTGDMYTFVSGVKTGAKAKKGGKGGQRVTATYNHPLLVVSEPDFSHKAGNGVDYTSWRQAKDIKKGDYLVYPKPLVRRDEDISFDIFADDSRQYIHGGSYKDIADATGFSASTACEILTGRYSNTSSAAYIAITAYAKDTGVTVSAKERPKTVAVTADFAKLCGLYVAEGSVQRRATKFSYNIAENDLVDFTRKALSALGVHTGISTYTDRNGIEVLGSSKHLGEFFVSEFGAGSLHKKLPNWLLNASVLVKKSFLSGYLAGDAKVTANSAVFTTISEDLFHGLRVLCADLGIYFRKVERKAEIVTCSVRGVNKVFNRKKQYSGSLGGKRYRDIAFKSGLSEESTLTRPREPYMQDDKFFYLPINEVEVVAVSKVKVYNFAVQDDNSYIANGFTSHNSDDRFIGINSSFTQRDGFVPAAPNAYQNMFNGREYGNDEIRTASGDPIAYVQLMEGQIGNVYSDKEMIFGVRNPRSNIYVSGYGYGELEQLITIITSHLHAETYNGKFFSNGSSSKGIINLKGDNWTPEMLENFQRQWHDQVAGNSNSWRTPILQSEGLEYIELNKTNREMEFGQWMDYLVRNTCGVYLIDPEEINFDLGGGSSQQPLFESSNEWKVKASRDKGLKPLLKFFAKSLNKHIIDRIDDHFEMEFVGLDEMSEQDKHNMLVEQLASYLTLNEVRRELDKPDIEGGDIPMNPTFIQAMQAQADAANGGGGSEKEPVNDGDQLAGAGDEEDEGPQMPDQFGMGNPSEAYSQ
ncbi:MAG: phage portal protein [Sulfurovum sp.]|nr:phage portal protein [Sulfurovum sp.]